MVNQTIVQGVNALAGGATSGFAGPRGQGARDEQRGGLKRGLELARVVCDDAHAPHELHSLATIVRIRGGAARAGGVVRRVR